MILSFYLGHIDRFVDCSTFSVVVVVVVGEIFVGFQDCGKASVLLLELLCIQFRDLQDQHLKKKKNQIKLKTGVHVHVCM